MSISLNNIITYGEAKFKVVKTATSKDIDTLNTKINEFSTIFRKNSTTYAVGDIAFSPSLPSSLLLECTVAGTTAATEPDFSDAVDNGTVTDGTVTWTYRKILSRDGSGGVPLAAIIPWDSDSNIIPPGFLECNGQAVSRTEYADLFGAIGTKYGSGDGSTTFNVPDYTDGVFLEGSDTAGTEHAPGLPNIEGVLDSDFLPLSQTPTGAFSSLHPAGTTYYYGANAANSYPSGFTLDASGSNAIYGNSTTVQPNSSTVRYLIKFIPSVPESEASAAASASVAQAAAQAAEAYAGSAGIPVGTLFPYAADTQTPPTGFLFCNGQAVSRTMYADLFAVLGTTWGAGDGETTFNLPTSEDLVLQGASTTNPVGTYLSAGLPNIEGKYRVARSGDSGANEFTGAIRSNGSTDNIAISSQNNSGYSMFYGFNFDASRSSAIYGNSDTVQPPAACVKFIIKAYDGVTPTSAGIDLSQYASDLGNKADRSLSNLDGNGEQKLTDTTESVVYEDGFAIIYPNGGSEGSPANVTANTRYVETNPFAGYVVKCAAEIMLSDEWGETGWYSYGANGYAYGVKAYQLNNNAIIVTVANSGVYIGDHYSGGPFGVAVATPTSTAPCRIKVWKVWKI